MFGWGKKMAADLSDSFLRKIETHSAEIVFSFDSLEGADLSRTFDDLGNSYLNFLLKFVFLYIWIKINLI